MTGELRAGGLAAAAGVNPQTLRYYERRGLLPRPDRTLGGHRVYPPAAVGRVRAIKAAQRLGFTLNEVTGLLAAGRRGRPDAGLRAGAEAKLTEIEQRIDDLAAARDALLRAVAAGCDDLDTCAGSPSCPLPFVEPPGGS
jgi:DNA-binding transcriptional MerR regulator